METLIDIPEEIANCRKDRRAFYLKSEKWKCGISDTKAHKWLVVNEVIDGKVISNFVCKCCNETKKIIKVIY